jgi:hypothetical protein
MPILTEITERLALHERTGVLQTPDKLAMQMNLDNRIALKPAEEIIGNLILKKRYCPKREGDNIYLTANDRFYEN